MLQLLLLFLCVDVPAGGRIPPAFPETRHSSPRSDAGESPVSDAVPGIQIPPVMRVEAPPPDNAEWLLRRMSLSSEPNARARAAEAWPISDAFVEDMDSLVLHLTDPEATVRAAALRRLTSFDDAQVFGYVMRTLVGGAAENVTALNSALPAFSSKLATLMLETLRTEIETSRHRCIAAWCLGRMGVHQATEILAAQLWQDDTELAQYSLDALFMLLSPESVPRWIEVLEHPDALFRQRATQALARTGGPHALEALRGLAMQEHNPLAAEALRQMSAWPAHIYWPLLVDVAEHNPSLRAYAWRILREQTGVNQGDSPTAWRNWIQKTMQPPPPPIVPAP